MGVGVLLLSGGLEDGGIEVWGDCVRMRGWVEEAGCEALKGGWTRPRVGVSGRVRVRDDRARLVAGLCRAGLPKANGVVVTRRRRGACIGGPCPGVADVLQREDPCPVGAWIEEDREGVVRVHIRGGYEEVLLPLPHPLADPHSIPVTSEHPQTEP